MKVLSAALFALLLALPLAAADVDGKWQATMQSPRGERQVKFTFKADGETLTGSVDGGFGGETAIEEGKITGDQLSFKQSMSRGDFSMTFVYAGKLSGDEIELTRKAEGGPGGGRGPREMTFTAKRVE